MTDTLRTIKSKIKDVYEDNSLSWFEYSYIVDWQVFYFSKKNYIPHELQDRRDRILCFRKPYSGPSSLREGLLP
jgi:hypothetical protein